MYLFYTYSGEEDNWDCDNGDISNGIVNRNEGRVTYNMEHAFPCNLFYYSMTADLDNNGTLINGRWSRPLASGTFCANRQ